MYPYLTTEERARLLAHSAPNGDCTDWTAGKSTAGYGVLFFRGRMTYAHRIAYIGTHGTIPDGLCIMHACDRPACLNPAHLEAGTKAQNNGDCKRKGRNNRGERNRAARLTAEQVQWARAQHPAMSYSQIAQALGVHIQTIASIIRRVNWRHLV